MICRPIQLRGHPHNCPHGLASPVAMIPLLPSPRPLASQPLRLQLSKRVNTCRALELEHRLLLTCIKSCTCPRGWGNGCQESFGEDGTWILSKAGNCVSDHVCPQKGCGEPPEGSLCP